MKIKKDLITHTNGHERTRRGNKIEFIVLHSMDGFFESTITYFKNPATTVSAHYLISKSGEILQMLEDTWTGYHAGNFDINLRSVGIELEDEKKRENWIYPKEEIKALKWLVNKLCRKYKISKDENHILLHKNLDPKNRTDPVGNFDINWVI